MTPSRVASAPWRATTITMIALAAVVHLSAGPAEAQPAQAPWDPLWVATSDAGSSDFPAASALNPSNGNVTVTGLSYRGDMDTDIATVSYSSAGQTLGGQGYTNSDVPGGQDNGIGVATGQNGYTYVTGSSDDEDGISAAVTIAYDRSGTQLWAATFVPGDGVGAFGSAVAVDDKRGTVFVAVIEGSGTSSDIVLLAYAADGQQLWTGRYDGPAGGSDSAGDVAVDPGTGQVYVGGDSEGDSTGIDYVSLAYSPTGEQLWVNRYDGPGNGDDYGTGIEFATGQVYVAGWSDGGSTGDDYATVAYSRAGRQLWVSRYHSGADNAEVNPTLAVDHLTGAVYLGGTNYLGGRFPGNYATVAYARDGSELWAAQYDGGGDEFAESIAFDTRRGIVYLTGSGERTPDESDYGYRTVAYSAGGDLLRADDYSVPDSIGADYVWDIVVDPRNGQVYVTGEGSAQGGTADYTTVAYPPAG